MKVFVTDYDGVIINIEPQKATVFGELLHQEWEADKNEVSRFWFSAAGSSRRSKFEYYYKKQFNKEMLDEQYTIIEAKFSNILKNEYYPNLQLLPGALQFLKFAKQHFDFTFVSSGVPIKEIQYLVALNHVFDYFHLVFGTDERYKTKNDHFKKIIDEYNPDLFILIADGLEDMNIAKEFNIVKSIGLTTNHSGRELKDAGADYTVDNLSNALTLMKSIL